MSDFEHHESPGFDALGRLIAPRFDDVYFSAADGLAETRHVFIQGNRLPERFAAMTGHAPFTVGETGFGTGLNFLATWAQFNASCQRGRGTLDYLSVEAYPLPIEVMRQALMPWEELETYRERMLGAIGPMIGGTHRFLFDGGRVRLTVLIGDAAEVLGRAQAGVDAWFLDGFSPAKNHGMWSEPVYAQVARLSRPGATLASYTCAGHVRRGLMAAGFAMDKRPGFGRKRQMITGVLPEQAQADVMVARETTPTNTDTVEVLVIGAGLAGCAAAAALAQAGLDVAVLDHAGVARGSSATPQAIMQPVVGHLDDRLGRYMRSAFAFAAHRLDAIMLPSEVSGVTPGLLRLLHDDTGREKASRFVREVGLPGYAKWVDADEASALLGVRVALPGVFFPQGRCVDPAALCARHLAHDRVRLIESAQAIAVRRQGEQWGVDLADGRKLTARRLVIANAMEAGLLLPSLAAELRPVAGQVLSLPSTPASAALRCPVYFGQYLTPAITGRHVLGATFHRGAHAIPQVQRDNEELLAGLRAVFPDLAGGFETVADAHPWSGVRCTTADHLPIVGQPLCIHNEEDADPRERNPGNREPGLYLSLAHGSRGVISSLLAAEVIACQVLGRVMPVEQQMLDAIDPARFTLRAQRRSARQPPPSRRR